MIVAIGYQTPLPFDTRARAYDYTPAVQQGAGAVAVGHYTREGGGSATFRRLLEGRIAPTVEKILTSTLINEASGDTPLAGCSYWTAG